MHSEQHFEASATVRDVVIGMSDGLTVPFALAAGLTGTIAATSKLVVIAGLAEIAAGSIAMGLGGYLAARTDRDHYESERQREIRETVELPEKETEEVADVFRGYGMSEQDLQPVVKAICSDQKRWVDFMMRFELGLEKPNPRAALLSAFRIGWSYALGGLVPLSAYFFTSTPTQGLEYSSLITVLCLLTFGYFKARLTGQNPFKGALTVTAIGIAAADASPPITTVCNPPRSGAMPVSRPFT